MAEDPILKIWLLEYDKFKAEQAQRIGFRNNLLYVTLGLFGVIIPTALITFFLLVPKPALALYLLGTLELISLLILATEITLYADLANGRLAAIALRHGMAAVLTSL
ncbi:MAG: hypothetical protein HC771_06485 [Synechococcales cyanobacterium CRU_2_2]|nr:hypothetical protein [Synechococcales cyanobacterium CRU_2_2]